MPVRMITSSENFTPSCGRQGSELIGWSRPSAALTTAPSIFGNATSFQPACLVRDPFPPLGIGRAPPGSTGRRVARRTGCGAAVPLAGCLHHARKLSRAVGWCSVTLVRVHRPSMATNSEPSMCPKVPRGHQGHAAWTRAWWLCPVLKYFSALFSTQNDPK